VAPRVLFIYNDPTAPEALLGEAFTELGFDTDTLEVVRADQVDDPAVDVAFPDPARYDAIVPLGSRWSVYDDALAWIPAEMAMVRQAVAAGVGVLGVCFGGQLVARALGGSVAPSAAPEIGWHEIDSDNPDLVPAGPWFQWHFDRWSLPPGATEVARNGSASQAFVLDRSLALQFHPELDRPLLELWLAGDRDGEVARLGLDADELRSRTGRELDSAARRLRGLVRGFLDHLAR
jgi:GMP synthase-like glutamine amidotransferase